MKLSIKVKDKRANIMEKEDYCINQERNSLEVSLKASLLKEIYFIEVVVIIKDKQRPHKDMARVS